jgi:hypothetical protein
LRPRPCQYCSSDFWSGAAPGGPNTPLNLSFMGSVIVQSVIADLVATQGMGSVPGARLLFSGCSAGGAQPAARVAEL